jgi:hypothetical protein
MARSIEEWRNVPGHRNMFIASSLGRIARIVGHNGANGYIQVSMDKTMKPFKAGSSGRRQPQSLRGYAHHLVALAFHGKPPQGRNQVNHKDERRSNNRPENLEWCNQKENLQHYRRMHPDWSPCGKPWKSSVRQWRQVRIMVASGMSYREVAAKVGLSSGGVRWIVKSPKYREVN